MFCGGWTLVNAVKGRRGVRRSVSQGALLRVDGLAAGEHVNKLRDAACACMEQGAAVTFVHVVSPALVNPSKRLAATMPIPPLPAYEEKIALDAAAERARDAGVDAEVVIVAGDAADEIVAYADTIDADLIVVGSRGLGAVKGLLLGRVSRAVLHEARRPVLVARSAAVSLSR